MTEGAIAHCVGDVVLLRKTTGGGVPPPYGRTDRLVGRGHALAVTVRQDRANGTLSRDPMDPGRTPPTLRSHPSVGEGH